MTIVHDLEHNDEAPIIAGTGIHVEEIGSMFDESGYSIEEITDMYLDLSKLEVAEALVYYWENRDEF